MNATTARKTYFVIFDPAKNLVVGKGERWSKERAEKFLRQHAEDFSVSTIVEREGLR